jgi:hypothetical protein
MLKQRTQRIDGIGGACRIVLPDSGMVRHLTTHAAARQL